MNIMRWLIALVLLAGGVGLYLYPSYHHATQGAEIDDLALAMQALESSEERVPSLNPKQRAKLEGAIRLDIPSIGLSGPVLETTTAENLDVALTKVDASMRPGEGNLAIAGHRSFVPGRLFNRLPDVEPGDVVTITDPADGTTYRYVVEEEWVVKPEDVSVLEPTETPSLTLITCTPIETAEDRHIVRATLVDASAKEAR